MANGFQTIVHPTDFSDARANAFAHALRIILAMRGTLHLVHVADSESFHDGFPHIRHALALAALRPALSATQPFKRPLAE
jgi:hypothetical protein